VQRLLFARLIVQDAPVILLDEPFNAVDPATAADLLAIVRRWHAEGRTVVAVLHDLALAEAVFPLALVLDGGVIAWGPASEALAPENRRRARLEREAWWRGPVSAARAA
jgi:zinc/manganese transport system ATP-binding protein